MARIGQGLEAEFEKQPQRRISSQEFALETKGLTTWYEQRNGKVTNMEELYLHSKKCVNLEKLPGNKLRVRSIVEGRELDYQKYSKIFSLWKAANLPKREKSLQGKS